uniref:Non-canonical purine NTP phosphatase/PRRC1 domain-containing protein n=1 Tax=Nyssomyia neivai TaxID=330878 RepID=A0A1L8DC65_9DIPT
MSDFCRSNTGGNLLSNVSSLSTDNVVIPPATPLQKIVHNIASKDAEPHISSTFSPAIPPTKNTSTEKTLIVDDISYNLNHLSLNPEPVATALGPLTQSSSSLFGWVKGAASSGGGILSKVAEKAKNSVDTIVTTLDPQMKEYLYSGGDIEIIVASDKDDKVKPCREAFQNVFGRATSNIAAQPVGFEAALRGVQDRIANIRANTRINNKLPIVAIEYYIFEAYPDQWFDAGLLILTDPLRNITLKTVTQMTEIPLSVITAIQEDTPKNYQFLDTGFAVAVRQIMSNNLGVNLTEWHKYYTGVSRSEMILNASKTLATRYKTSL